MKRKLVLDICWVPLFGRGDCWDPSSSFSCSGNLRAPQNPVCKSTDMVQAPCFLLRTLKFRRRMDRVQGHLTSCRQSKRHTPPCLSPPPPPRWTLMQCCGDEPPCHVLSRAAETDPSSCRFHLENGLSAADTASCSAVVCDKCIPGPDHMS